MSESKPVVRRAFKYGKKFYQPGELFEPQGQPNDAVILKSSLITYQTAEAEPKRGRGKAKPYAGTN